MHDTGSLGLRLCATLIPLLAAGLSGGCKGENVGTDVAPLTAVCVDPADSPPPDAWVCGHDETVECTTHEGAYVDFIYAQLAPDRACATNPLFVDQPGPFPPGSYTITVGTLAGDGGPAALCTSELTVVDTAPPQAIPHEVTLWPPNHKYRHVSLADCVTIQDACDPSVRAWLTSASSDEPADSTGDGSTLDDIANLGCDGVDLRAERQGTGDGRVYTLGWHAEDHAGNAVEGTCRVLVPHDQGGGAAIDSGEDHRVDLPLGGCQ